MAEAGKSITRASSRPGAGGTSCCGSRTDVQGQHLHDRRRGRLLPDAGDLPDAPPAVDPGLVADPADVQRNFEAIAGVVPEDPRSIMVDQLTAVTSASGGKLGFGVV